MKVEPLIIPQMNWPIFTEICQQQLGESPTRGLDQAGISLKELRAIATAISMHNSDTVHSANQWAFLPLAFIIKLEHSDSICKELHHFSQLDVMYRHVKNKAVLILSGRGITWRQAIAIGCTAAPSTEYRLIFNNIHSLINQMGLQDLFAGMRHSNIINQDGTFTLCQQ